MKRTFLRITSVALVLLLLFAVGGCAPKEYQTLTFEEASKNELTIYLDKNENFIIQQTNEILLQESLNQFSVITLSTEILPVLVSTQRRIAGEQDCTAAIQLMCTRPLFFKRMDAPKNSFDDSNRKLRFQTSQNISFVLIHLDDGTLIYEDHDGYYYCTKAGVFDYDAFCEFEMNYENIGGSFYEKDVFKNNECRAGAPLAFCDRGVSIWGAKSRTKYYLGLCD